MRRRLPALGAPLALALALTSVASRGDDIVALAPAAPPWRAARVLGALRDGARDPRELRVETTPPAAAVALVYLRDGVQLAAARGASPLRAALPSRARTAEGDRIVVRAESAGFAAREIVLDAREVAPTLRVELIPLPARIVAASLLELGDWARLELSSDKPIEARLAATELGWRLVLADASASEAVQGRVPALRGAALARVEMHSVGSDLLLALERGPKQQGAPRLLRREEPLRSLSHLDVEWLPEDRGAAALARGSRALARAQLDACAAAFDAELFSELGRDALARSLASRGTLPDALVARALAWLATQSPEGTLALRDGTRIALDGSVGRARAAAQPADARAILHTLRTLAESLAPPGTAHATLHAWLAPELAEGEFATRWSRAAAIESSCRARS
jgi:hypothetical protein